jgi:hypothetical protein
VAEAFPISAEVVAAAHDLAIAELDASFFRIRFDRLTPKEKRYLRAMAELGPGPHRSGDIAAVMDVQASAWGHGTHGEAVRRVHAAGHGGVALDRDHPALSRPATALLCSTQSGRIPVAA